MRAFATMSSVWRRYVIETPLSVTWRGAAPPCRPAPEKVEGKVQSHHSRRWFHHVARVCCFRWWSYACHAFQDARRRYDIRLVAYARHHLSAVQERMVVKYWRCYAQLVLRCHMLRDDDMLSSFAMQESVGMRKHGEEFTSVEVKSHD